MAEDVRVTPSVWDRLFNNRPIPPAQTEADGANARTDTIKSKGQGPRQYLDIEGLKRCVARDLELMLNTKRVLNFEPTEEMDPLRDSIVSYGLPDFSSHIIASRSDRKRIERAIEDTIKMHEPRLKRVKVSVDEPARAVERTWHFRVDAWLQIDQARAPVSFDAVLQVTTQLCELKRHE